MPKVNVLDDHIANLIAAGEVVIDPKSVIKELVENALDANATQIEIILEQSGFELIMINDNGCGMNYIDALNSIKRHATSKISNEQDLNCIETLGFRGEAIPSIASVSYFTLETSSESSSSKIVIDGGVVKEKIKQPFINKGTKIKVEKLFYNTPARLKHQVSPSYILRQIKEYVYQMSLINENVSFSLIHNDMLLFQSYENDLVANVSQIYGVEVAKNIINVFYEDMDFEISGYFIDPKYSKSNKKDMIFSINKRIIWSNSLATSIIEALKSYLMVNKYPISYIDIKLDSTLIDVNVHPQKRTVKISKEKELILILQKVISQTMLNNFKLFDVVKNSKDNYNENILKSDVKITKNTSKKSIFDLNDSQTNELEFNNFESSYDNLKQKENSNFVSNNNQIEVNEKQIQDLEFENNSKEKDITLTNNKNLRKKNNLGDMIYIGQYLNSYLIMQSGLDLFLVDQHAAMERINYEKYLYNLKNIEKYVVNLAVPITIELSLIEIEILNSKKQILEQVAISFEQFGTTTILIRQVPSFINSAKMEKFLNLIFEKVLNEKDLNFEMLINEIAIIKACKLSIKAKQELNNFEVQMLIEELKYVENYTSCPHGRPLIIKLKLNQIEKWFKRIN